MYECLILRSVLALPALTEALLTRKKTSGKRLKTRIGLIKNDYRKDME